MQQNNGIKLSQSLEDHLEAIYQLGHQQRSARVSDIASLLNLNKSTVVLNLKKLAAAGLVVHKRYRPVSLTTTGQQLARQVFNRHTSLASFFTGILDIEEDKAVAAACRVEHQIGSDTANRLRQLTEFLQQQQQQNGLLTQFKKWACFGRTQPGLHLRHLEIGTKAVITGYAQLNRDYRQKLLSLGLAKGEEIELVNRAPLGDPLCIRHAGQQISLRRDEADELLVQKVVANAG